MVSELWREIFGIYSRFSKLSGYKAEALKRRKREVKESRPKFRVAVLTFDALHAFDLPQDICQDISRDDETVNTRLGKKKEKKK